MVGSKVQKGTVEVYGSTHGAASGPVRGGNERFVEGFVEDVGDSTNNERRRVSEGGNPTGPEEIGDDAAQLIPRLPLAGEEFVLFAEALCRHIMPATEAAPNATRRRSARKRLPRGQLQSLVWTREPRVAHREEPREERGRVVSAGSDRERTITREEREDRKSVV